MSWAFGQRNQMMRIATLLAGIGLAAPVSQITGGRRYPFSINGQYCLVQRCSSDQARHATATGSPVVGPNVFLDCLAEHPRADTGPHHRWAGAQQVFWNCVTTSICVQQPPTAQDYAISGTGAKATGALKGRTPGCYVSHGRHVTPRSLYLAQLEERLGPKAVANVTTQEQRDKPLTTC